MVSRWQRRFLLLAVTCLLILILAGCVDSRELGRQAGELARQLALLAQQFIFGFIEGCCAGLVVSPATLVLVFLSFIVNHRRGS